MAREMSGTGASTGAGAGASERVEIVTRGEGRRSFSAEEKVRLVAETFQPGETVTGVSRRHGICTSLLHRWRRAARGARRAARGEVPQRRAPAPRLLPVRLVAPGAPAPPPAEPSGAAGGVAPASIEVVLRNGRMLRVGATTDAAAVARLAAALEA
jgi:transposase